MQLDSPALATGLRVWQASGTGAGRGCGAPSGSVSRCSRCFARTHRLPLHAAAAGGLPGGLPLLAATAAAARSAG